jgi:hypothetical protein
MSGLRAFPLFVEVDFFLGLDPLGFASFGRGFGLSRENDNREEHQYECAHLVFSGILMPGGVCIERSRLVTP